MSLLFINACMREESRTERLARAWLDRYEGEVRELRLSELDIKPLTPESLKLYNESVASATYDDPMFAFAKEFAAANEVLIAAPFWNYSVPALLHDYLELVCTQGLTFDIDDTGAYVSLCDIHKLTFVCTAGGGEVPELDDHAFGYLRTLATEFWHVPQVERVAAWGLDGPGANIDALLEAALG